VVVAYSINVDVERNVTHITMNNMEQYKVNINAGVEWTFEIKAVSKENANDLAHKICQISEV